MTLSTNRPGPRPRKEDARLLLGKACFTDDVHLDGMVHGVFIRSPMAHAKIKGIDASAALAAGALCVLTAEDLPFIDQTFIVRQSNPHIRGGLPTFLARGRVRFVGEPIALLVAADRYVAEDLAQLVEVALEPLPAVAGPREAMADGAPSLHEAWPGNVAAAFTRKTGDAESALAAAPRRLARTFSFGRQAPLPLETRGCVADFDRAAGSLRIWTSIQTHYQVRQNLAATLGLPESRIRVIATDVGGGFGSKSRPYVEDILVSHASRLLGRPVKWIEDRFEHLQATTHSRSVDTEVELGYDEEGRIHALRALVVSDIGAYVFSSGIITSEMATAMLAGAYRIPHLAAEVFCVGSNKTPLATYRGAGQPEGILPLECMLDLVARDVGLSGLEVRRRNLVTPADFPYPIWAPRDGIGELESGDFPRVLEQAASLAPYDEALETLPSGEVAAWGLACGLELTGSTSFESASVRLDADGSVTVRSGMSSQGQGHATTYAEVCAELLGIDRDRVAVSLGDTDLLAFGRGAFGSRGAVVGANAVAGATRRLIERILGYASRLEGEQAEALRVEDGVVRRADGTVLCTLAQVAGAAAPGGPLFDGEVALEAQFVFDTRGRHTYALSVHAARVAVDRRSGFVRVIDYAVVHDAGRALDPAVVEGQVLGGVAEGIGGTLLSELVYSDEAQLLTGTLADYMVATATEIPRIRVGHVETAASTNPLGVRGIGEGGVIPAAPAIVNAIARAIDPSGIGHQGPLYRIPVKPPAVLEACRMQASR